MRVSYNNFQTLRPGVLGSWATQGPEGKDVLEKEVGILQSDSLTSLQNLIGWGTNTKTKNNRLAPILSAAKDSNLNRFTPLVELFTRESTPTLTLTRRSLTTQNSARQTLRSWSGRRCVTKLTKLKFFNLTFIPRVAQTPMSVVSPPTCVLVGHINKLWNV